MGGDRSLIEGRLGKVGEHPAKFQKIAVQFKASGQVMTNVSQAALFNVLVEIRPKGRVGTFIDDGLRPLHRAIPEGPPSLARLR